MADITKKVNVQFTSDTKGLEQGASKATSVLGSVASAAPLAAGAIAAVAAAVAATYTVIQRGQAVDELSRAFDNLYGKAGTLANEGLPKLRAATQGLISDLDLLKQANFAAQAGMRPEDFLKLAAAADSLGDVVGKDTTTAFTELTAALVKGNERGLENLGIMTNSVPAAQKYAEAFRQIEEKQKNAGEGSKTAADALTKIGNAISSGYDTIGLWVNRSPLLVASLEAIGNAARDASNYLNGIFGNNVEALNTQIAGKLADIRGAQNAKIYNVLDLAANAAAGGRQERIDKLAKEVGDLLIKRDELVESANTKASAPNSKANPFNPFLNSGAVDAAKKKIEELSDALDKALSGTRLEGLKKSLGDALSSGDTGLYASLSTQIQSSIEDGVYTEFAALGNDPRVAELAKLTGDQFGGPAAEAMAEHLKQGFQDSVTFFADVFENAITGAAFDLEDMLKRVAVGFAAQLAAGIAQSMGLNLSGIGSAQGLGGMLGSSLGDLFGLPTGGTAGIGSIFGSSGIGSAISSLFGGSAGSPVAAGSSLFAQSAVPSATEAALGIGAAGGGAAIGSTATGGTFSAGLGAAAAAIPWAAVAAVVVAVALPKIIDALEGTFGGTTNKETLARRAFRDGLKDAFGDDLLVNTVKGKQSLTQVDYANLSNFIKSSPVGNQSVGLATGIGEVLGGGGKLGEDATAIFAQLIGQADNFNEAIINSLSIMDQLGLSASDAKDKLKDLFLDGKVGLDVFGTGIQNLNLLAQNDLVGPNSVADALKVIGDNIKNPRIALKGLELAFKEMADLGIDTSSEVVAYLTDKFGPDIAGVFAQITATGLDTWEEIKNANADQLFAIFQALQGWQSDVTDVFDQTARTIADSFTQAGTDAADGFISGTQPLIEHAKKVDKAWKDTANQVGGYIKDIAQNALDNGGGGKLPKSGGAGSNVVGGNVANNTFRA